MKNKATPPTCNTAAATATEIVAPRPKDLDDACRAGMITSADDLRLRVQRVPPPQSATTNGHAPPDAPPATVKPDLTELDERRISLTAPPEKPVPIYRLAEQVICTAGNLTVISAQAKAGKSAALGCIIAAAIASETCDHDDPLAMPDTLGFVAAPHHGKAVILLDTEQAPYDAWTLINRAVERVGADMLPVNFRGYHVADLDTRKRRVLLAAELERASVECGGIHSVFIDGIADLCQDPNDPAEAFGLVEELVQLAIRHACPLLLVLHQNPSASVTGKTRGHLGSQLERKAESNLVIEKDAKGISSIYSERCRRAAIPKATGPRFAWCAKAAMHVSVADDGTAEKAKKKREEQQPAVDAVFDGIVGNLSWSDLKQRVMDKAHLKDRTAERRIKEWEKLGLIHTPSKGEWCRK